MDQMWIVLGIMLVFVIGMLFARSYGMVTVGCLILLCVFGIMTPAEAFSGFGDKQVVLMAGMFVVSYAFSKTSVIDVIQKKLFSGKQGKADIAIVVTMLGFTALLAQYVASVTSILMIMMAFLAGLGRKSSVTTSRMMLPVLFIASIFVARFPIGGGGASGYIMPNALLSGAGVTELLDVTSIIKASLIPALLCLLYSIFSYKLLPDKEVDVSSLSNRQAGPDAPKLAKKDEIIIYICFIGAIVGMLFGGVLGDLMYIVPAAAAVLMMLFGVLKTQEVLKVIANDTLFLGAGVIVLSEAVTNSGAGEYIGNLVLRLLGSDPSPWLILVLISVIAVLMTTFMSNFVSMMVLTPIAIQVCLACNYDPRAVVLCIHFLVWVAIVTPMASPATALAYGAAGLSVKETLKWTLPAVLIAIVSVIICSYLAYPM